MKLRELYNNVTLQGEIRIKIYSHKREHYSVSERIKDLMRIMPDFWSEVLDREITYIYAQCNEESGWEDETVIEVEHYDDIHSEEE